MQPFAADRKSIPFVALYALLCVTYLAGLGWLRNLSWSEKKKGGLILCVAVVLRLILLPGPPLLDDDIYRYRWDGKLMAHGQNPFAYPPEAPQLAALQENDPLYDLIGFRDIPAVYPPASQVLFAGGYALEPEGIGGIKVLVVLCDVGAILALIGLLLALGRSTEGVAIYAWHPLVLKEFANSGHHDAAGIALLALALWAIAANRRGGAAAAFGLSTLIKPIVLLLAPAVWGRLRRRDWIVWGALLVAAYLPFSAIGPKRLFDGMALYSRYWEMNDGLFALIQAAFGGPVPSRHPGFLFETNPAARIMAFSLWLVVACWMVYDAVRERRGLPLAPGPSEGGILRVFWRMGILLATVLALTPTLDPWYVCWLIPFLCLFSWGAARVLTVTVALSYLYYWQGRDFWWLRPAEYLPVMAWFVLAGVRARTTSFRQTKEAENTR